MITEVENIILNKEYFELSAEELTAVNELVQNAEEYEEMKWFLASTQGALVSEKIEATPELKDKVMNHLNQDKGKRMFWLNSVGVFLWPTEKEVYRRPAFQMSLAALLLIGFLMVYNRDIVPNEGTMALNEDQINETITTFDDESAEGKGDELNKDLESTVEGEEDELTDEDNLLEQPLVIEPADDEGPVMEPAVVELDEVVTEVEDSEEEMEMTHDGWYQPEEKETSNFDSSSGDMGNSNSSNTGSDEDYERKNTSNANNNELSNTRVDAQNNDQVEELKQNKPGKIILAETESLSKNEQNYKKKDKDKKGQSDDTDNRDGFNYDINDVVNSSDISTDSTVVVTGNNQTTGGGNNGIDNTTEMQDPHNMGMYNTTTIDGNFGTTESNEYFPTQMGISSTKELKSLFTTFK